MKRSVIQFAGKTFLISLPKAWADSQHIHKGQELEIHPEGSKLIINATMQKEKRELALSAKDAAWLTADILSFAYQLGIDEITITYDKSGIGAILGVKAAQLLGFEVIDERPGISIIKNVASQLEEEYPALLRRCFYIIEEMGILLVHHAKKPEREVQDQMRALDLAVNKLTDFCKRTINKQEAHSAIATATSYTIVRDLEKIGDCYRDACLAQNQSVPQRTQSLILNANRFFRLLHSLSYEFSDARANEFQALSRRLQIEGSVILRNARGEETLLLHNALSVITLVRDLFGPLYILELSKRKQKQFA